MSRKQRRKNSKIRRRLQRANLTTAAEHLETRQMLSVNPITVDSTASIDGTDNNEENAEWGSTGVELIRITTPEYSDGVGEIGGEARASAREVSNAVAAQTEDIANDRYLTDYVWVWGQFIDHDIDLTHGADPEEVANIEVPTGDQYFDPFGTGTAEIDFSRSTYVDPSVSSDGLRQQTNDITAFIDGSVVYGSDQERADELREFVGGRLKTSDGDLLPYNEAGLDNAGGTSDALFLAGDVRANENVVLSSMHTIWVREHNRIADEITANDPSLSDEEIYQQARQRVTAQLQAITYNEFLPALLGNGALSEYEGYNSDVNAGIANIFSTAAYRLGHSLLSSELQRVDADGNVIAEGNLPLQNGFFRPDVLAETGVDPLLQGAATQLAQELDTQVIDDVRNFLFGHPGSGGFDLASLNIQRGRDHGLPDYNQAGVDLGLESVTSFADITSDVDVQQRLASVYDSVDEIDVWVGGLAEDHVPGSNVGELFQTILVDQFERLRDGDRFWYENVFEDHELREIDSTSLADVIERNSGVTGLQENVFFADSVLVVSPTGRDGDLHVIVEDDNVVVRDRRSGRVVSETPTSEVERVMVMSGDGDSEVTITINATGDVLGGGIEVNDSAGRRDRVIVQATREADVISVDGTSVNVNGVSIDTFGIEELVVDGRDGGDSIDASASTVERLSIHGGRDADQIVGSPNDDVLFVNLDIDTVDGNGGNDRLVDELEGRRAERHHDDRGPGQHEGRRRDRGTQESHLTDSSNRRSREISDNDALFSNGINELLQSDMSGQMQRRGGRR